jgi:hypothetical protein
MNSKVLSGMLLVSSVLGACGGSDNAPSDQATPATSYIRANANNDTTNTSLSYHLAVLSQDDWPVQGTVVIAYQNNNYVTYAKTNSRGVASLQLPEGSAALADLHIVYWEDNDYASILTIADLAPGDRIIRIPSRNLLAQSGLGLYDSSATDRCSQTTLNVYATNNTPSSGQLWSEYVLPLIHPTVNHGGSFEICNRQRQLNGLSSFLLMNYGYSAAPWTYGFLLDQKDRSGQTFDLTLDRTASTLDWQTVDGNAPSYLWIEGARHGKLSRVAEHLGPRGLGAQGQMAFADQFPVDHYVVKYGLTADNNMAGVTEIRTQISGPLNLALPTTRIATAALEKSAFSPEITARWEIDAPANTVDYIALQGYPGENGKLRVWKVLLPPTRTSWTFPYLQYTGGAVHSAIAQMPASMAVNVISYPDLENYDTYLERLTQLDESGAFTDDVIFGTDTEFRFDLGLSDRSVVTRFAALTEPTPDPAE